MDGELNSSRYDKGSRPHHHHHHHHHERRPHRGGRYRGGGGGRHHRQHRHHPYGGGGGRRNNRSSQQQPRGNRFTATKSVDQKTAVMEQLSAMVSRVGDVEPTPENSRADLISKNITDLAKVLCSPNNSELFLGFVKTEESSATTTVDAKEQAGHLAHLVVSCVMALPLQTSTHVGLTLAVHEYAPSGFEGFADRCVTYAMRILSKELDSLHESNSVLRIEHLLRYLVLLGKINVVASGQDDEGSVLSLLQSLVTAARQAVDKNKNVAYLLTHVIFSTIPFLIDYIPSSVIQEQLVEPLETHVFALYKSTYWPGLGKDAILLKQEQKEATEEEEDEEEDSEDDEDDEEAGQRCDTLQDMVRTVKTLLEEEQSPPPMRFSLLSDAPWLGLVAEKKMANSQDGEQNDENPQEDEAEPLVYTDEPLRLALSPDCRSIPALLNGSEELDLSASLQGVVHGRLPMFGGPASDDDDEEEGMEEEAAAPANAQLQAYQKNFGLVDRFFLAHVVRDCLASHKSTVSDSGLERGSAKDTAKQLLTIQQVFAEKDGIEYGIIETVLSLIVQSNDKLMHFYYSRILLELTRLQPQVMAPALVVGVTNLVQDYLPSLVPRARENLSTWFAFHLENTDYQWPAGYWEHWTPYIAQEERNSRGDFCQMALQTMASHVSSISTVCTNCLPQKCTADEALVLLSLVDKTDGKQESDQDVGSSIQQDLETRLWDMSEDADAIREYMVGDEVSETLVSQGQERPGCRSRLVLRALLRPAKQQKERMIQSIRQVKEENQGNDNDDIHMVTDTPQTEEIKHDVLTEITDMLARYKPVLLATLAKDCEGVKASGGDESSLLQAGEAHLLMQLEETTHYSPVILLESVKCLLQNEVLSAMGALRWALRDTGVQGGEGSDGAAKQWWKFVEMALSTCLELRAKDDGDDIGMEVDGDDLESPKPSALSKMLDVVSPLLKYVIERVCKMLSSMDNQDGKLKHTPTEVDLIEGVKQLVLASHSMLLLESTKAAQDESGKKQGGVFRAELAQSEIEGSKFASLCRSHDDGVSPATELMAQMLDGIAHGIH